MCDGQTVKTYSLRTRYIRRSALILWCHGCELLNGWSTMVGSVTKYVTNMQSVKIHYTYFLSKKPHITSYWECMCELACKKIIIERLHNNTYTSIKLCWAIIVSFRTYVKYISKSTNDRSSQQSVSLSLTHLMHQLLMPQATGEVRIISRITVWCLPVKYSTLLDIMEQFTCSYTYPTDSLFTSL